MSRSLATLTRYFITVARLHINTNMVTVYWCCVKTIALGNKPKMSQKQTLSVLNKCSIDLKLCKETWRIKLFKTAAHRGCMQCDTI